MLRGDPLCQFVQFAMKPVPKTAYQNVSLSAENMRQKPRFLDCLRNGNHLSHFTSALAMEWLNIFTSADAY